MIKHSPVKLKKKTIHHPNFQNWKQMTLHIHFPSHFSSILFDCITTIFIIETESRMQGL